MPAYRRTNLETLVWLGAVLAGLALGIAGGLVASRYTESAWSVALVFVGMIGGIAVAVWGMRTVKRRRKEAIRLLLESEGFAVDLAPSPERSATVFAPVAHLQGPLELTHGAERIDWLAIHSPSTLMFEHYHVSGSGRSTVEHTRMVLVVSAAHATLTRARFGAEPTVWSERPGLLRRRLLRKLGTIVSVGDAAFDRQWLTSGHRATAEAFFSPDVRRRLRESPRGEVWHIGQGFVCCAYRAQLNGKQLARMLRHARAVLSS